MGIKAEDMPIIYTTKSQKALGNNYNCMQQNKVDSLKSIAPLRSPWCMKKSKEAFEDANNSSKDQITRQQHSGSRTWQVINKIERRLEQVLQPLGVEPP